MTNAMSHSFTFVRHGLSIANKNGIVQGQMDYPLSQEGIEQSEALAAYWVKNAMSFDLIIASPLARAKKTAEIIAGKLGLQIVFDDQWKERLAGSAQGMAYGEVETLLMTRQQPSSHEPLFDEGESEWDLFMRAAAAVQDLVRRHPGRYLIVAHGAILSAALRSILGISPPSGRSRPVRISFENTGYSILDYDSGLARWTLKTHNLTCHLKNNEYSEDLIDE